MQGSLCEQYASLQDPGLNAHSVMADRYISSKPSTNIEIYQPNLAGRARLARGTKAAHEGLA